MDEIQRLIDAAQVYVAGVSTGAEADARYRTWDAAWAEAGPLNQRGVVIYLTAVLASHGLELPDMEPVA